MVTATSSRWEADALRIGAAVKRHRVAIGLSQADVARQAGIARADYEVLETGDWPIRTTVESVVSLLAAVLQAMNPQPDAEGNSTLAA